MPSRPSLSDSRWLLASGVLARACAASAVVGLLGLAVVWALHDVF
ncbi:hypothetical protein [Ideonella oryzae]|nr:hypothetical protein [Ideonella oryzae]